jgi:hypothetical protein
MAGSHQLFEQRTWPVFRISELVVEDLHHREQHIEPYHVGERQRTDRVIATELHSLAYPSASTKKASLIIGNTIPSGAKKLNSTLG